MSNAQSKDPRKSLRSQSKTNWGRNNEIPTNADLTAGSLMRIADKLEDETTIRSWTVEELIRVGRDLIRTRKRHPRRDQFHFSFEHPKTKTYFEVSVFGLTLSIHKK